MRPRCLPTTTSILPLCQLCRPALRYIRDATPLPFHYLGMDIVSSLIARHNRQHADMFTKFIQAGEHCTTPATYSIYAFCSSVTQCRHADAPTLAVLPKMDLVFSRMMMQHQCDKDVVKMLRLIETSGTPLPLSTPIARARVHTHTHTPFYTRRPVCVALDIDLLVRLVQ